MVYTDSRKAQMGKSELYLNIRDDLSHPGLTQKMREPCAYLPSRWM